MRRGASAAASGDLAYQAKFLAANSQFTSAQKFSRYLGRALR